MVYRDLNQSFEQLDLVADAEEEEKLRLEFLKFLLFNLKENPDEYVYTQEILDNLNAIRDVKMGQHKGRIFRRKDIEKVY
jgi:hypothetical protein